MNDDTQRINNDLPRKTCSPSTDPSLTFESITFSDGTMISLEPTDVVVLVGPNNAGKSVALRELETNIMNSSRGTVVTQVTFRRTGTLDDLQTYLGRHSKEDTRQGEPLYVGYQFSIYKQLVGKLWSGTRGHRDLSPLFCMRLQTETRITDSDPAPAIRILEDAVSHPIQMLYTDDDLEYRISDYFRQAFGADLIVFRSGGNEFPLLVGCRLAPRQGEDRVSASYCRRLLDSTVPLRGQGDGMRSFASVILHLLAPITPSILILDEPEAFLHPPQARLLGELIAKERSSRAQLFVATHSPDVLNGLLNVAPDNLRVLRIRREDRVNYVKELHKERAKEISTDPLMKYSSVLSGVFHERVIICESDSDCTFYSSVLDLPEVHGVLQPDVLFIHANGKDRMATLAKALKELDVPVDVIADLDILNSTDVLKDIFETLGGAWVSIQSMVQTIRNDIESHKSWLNAGEIKKAILEKLDTVSPEDAFPRQKRSEVEAIFKKATPWDAVKQAGEAAIPAGQATKQFKKLQALCKEVGLWIVPVGELEGFCRSVGGHGPRWVQRVIQTLDLSTDADLQRAREFVSEIWSSRDSG